MLTKVITNATNILLSSYELVGGVEHDGEKGAFREFFLANFLRPLLPQQFGVGSGVVVDAYGKQSHQTDIVIYDRRRLPPLMLVGDRGIYPVDSVLAMIEVKSVLRATHYRDIVKAARCIEPPDGLRIVTRGTMGNDGATLYPLFAVFAYTSDAEDKDEFVRLREQVKDGTESLHVVCVLDKGLWAEGRLQQLSKVHSENATQFVLSVFNRLEEVSDTRGRYRLQDWLDNSVGQKCTSSTLSTGLGPVSTIPPKY